MSESKPPPSETKANAKRSQGRIFRNRGKKQQKESNTEDKEASGEQKPPRPVAPTKAETALLPPFTGISPNEIYVPKTQEECRNAVDEIFSAGVVGFDTETKPIFRAGQKCVGPHVVQFALTHKAFIFQLHHPECEEAVCKLIKSEEVLKVGFGLKNDHKQIRNRLGIALKHVLDLDQTFKEMGYRGQIGVRGAIGVLLEQGFKKSKATTTSNWALPTLTPKQLLYAANDAFAALKTMEALKERGYLKK